MTTSKRRALRHLVERRVRQHTIIVSDIHSGPDKGGRSLIDNAQFPQWFVCDH